MRRTYNDLKTAVDYIAEKNGLDIQLENNGPRAKFTTKNGSKNLSTLMSVAEAHEWFAGYVENAIKVARIRSRLNGILHEDLSTAEKQILAIIEKDGI